MLLTLTEQWKKERDKRNVIAAISIDFSKPFDCQPHNLLLEKLKFYGMNDKAVNLLNSCLSSRYQRVGQAWHRGSPQWVYSWTPAI